MSLADELLADLEDDETIEDEFAPGIDPNEALYGAEGGQQQNLLESTSRQYASVKALTKVIDSDELKRIMAEINSREDDCKYS